MPYTHEGKALYLTADKSEIVEEGDDRAAFLLVAEGGELDDTALESFGLTAENVKPGKIEAPTGGRQGVIVSPEEEDREIRMGGKGKEEEEKARQQAATKSKEAPPNKSRG